jgi:hypothetical protein
MPPEVTAQLANYAVTRGRFKRVDLERDDGRTFAGVWVLDDRWPISARRAFRGFRPPRVVGVRDHVP